MPTSRYTAAVAVSRRAAVRRPTLPTHADMRNHRSHAGVARRVNNFMLARDTASKMRAAGTLTNNEETRRRLNAAPRRQPLGKAATDAQQPSSNACQTLSTVRRRRPRVETPS